MRRKSTEQIKKEDVVNFYKTHTLKETAKHFQIGQAKVRDWCKELGFEKPSFTWANWSEETKERAKTSREKSVQEKYGVPNALCLGLSKMVETKNSDGWADEHRDSFRIAAEKASKTRNTPEYKDHIAPIMKEVGKKAGETRRNWPQEKKDERQETYEKTCLDRYGVKNTWALSEQVYHSNGEEEVRKFIESLGFQASSNKAVIHPYELDIYLPEKKFAIEYNGTYWHSTEQKQDKLYHYKKSEACEKVGIRLFHIFEWEWSDPIKRDVIKSILRTILGKTENRIYARNCEIRNVGTSEYRDFCNKHHLQGYRQASLVYGLYFENELVQLMSFSKPQKRNAKVEYQWEIVRGCPGSNNVVVGGVSKLWKHFLKEQNPESVMSYCDMNKFDGKSYLELGMTLAKIEKGNRWFINKKTGRVSSWLFRNKEKREKQAEECFEVFGVGNKTFVWICDCN